MAAGTVAAPGGHDSKALQCRPLLFISGILATDRLGRARTNHESSVSGGWGGNRG